MKKILIVRHDKIGDFVLSWPAIYQLRQAFPEAQIDIMVAPVVVSLALACPYIDNAFADTENDYELTGYIREKNYDAALIFHSQSRICKIVRDASVPYTLGPKMGFRQFLYSQRTSIKYKKGEACWRGNCMLVEHFLRHENKEIPQYPVQYWDVSETRQKWQAFYQKAEQEKLIFVHPGSGGSSNSLSVEQFAQLLLKMKQGTTINFKTIITYSGQEKVLADELLSRLNDLDLPADLAKPLDSLADFAESIVAADMFIAGSTGPVHLAGLHNVPTVGFYAGRKSQPKVRWQTLSQAEKRLAFTPPEGRKTGRDMSLVDIDSAAEKIATFINQKMN